ncbi:MAG: ABC transporter substrate-binding protein [Cytophagales bacterium]|nr:ABC transporter substrate-binding protein [Cytophagales bacterium]
MKLTFQFSFLLLFFLFSCEESKVEHPQNNTDINQAKGGRFYGGTFRTNESEYIESLFPHQIIDPVSRRVASYIFEGLMTYNPKTMQLEGNIANYYKVDSNRTHYTFFLKHDIYFHDNECFPQQKGRELVAKDVEYCFRLLQQDNKLNRGNKIFRNVFAEKDSGVVARSKYRVDFYLKKPNNNFLNLLASSFTYIFPREAYELYGNTITIHPVGTGAFQLRNATDFNENLQIVLRKNKHYHHLDEFGNQLPYLDGIKITFLKEKQQEVKLFKNDNLDYIQQLPKKEFDKILTDSLGIGEYNDFKIQHKPELSTHYLGFNLQGKVFTDTLRRAISYAINTQQLISEIIPYDSTQQRTITPYGLYSNKADSVLNVPYFNLDSAQKYLALAGYPQGKGFPKIAISLYTNGGKNAVVAKNIRKQLKEHLNIVIEINPMALNEYLETVLTGRSAFYLGEFHYQGTEASDFLQSFYGKHKNFPNITNFQDYEFNVFFENALISKKLQDKTKYLLKAEQRILDKTGIITLWHEHGFKILQPKVRNFYNNALALPDFSEVYFQPPHTLKEVY